MIDEFKQGITCDQNVETDFSYGVMKNVITVSKRTNGPPPAKKVKLLPSMLSDESM